VLVGLLVGVALCVIPIGRAVIMPALGQPARVPGFGGAVSALAGASWTPAAWALESFDAVGWAFFIVLLIVLLRLAFRWPPLVMSIAVVLLSFPAMTDISALVDFVFPLASGVLLTVVAVRFGLLALVATMFAWGVLLPLPATLHVTHWSAAASNWTLAGLAALACWAFYASRGRQPLFGAGD
jgi:hypothetical protein